MLGAMSALTMAAVAGESGAATQPQTRTPSRKIATEEACSIPEVAQGLREVARSTSNSLDMKLVGRIYNAPPERSAPFLADLLDIDAGRLQVMDENSVDMHILSLTAPGVQMFDADTGVALAALANDRIAEAVRRHPKRFAGLATFAPQDPVRAVKEMERALGTLKLNGFIINSHTNNEYLDQEKFWPILEAAEALDAAIYIHPPRTLRRHGGAFPRLQQRGGGVGIRRGDRYARGPAHAERRIRSLSETQDSAGTHG
jgi:predicted TIM-barrel fold metal-dependent hydrolase